MLVVVEVLNSYESVLSELTVTGKRFTVLPRLLALWLRARPQ